MRRLFRNVVVSAGDGRPDIGVTAEGAADDRLVRESFGLTTMLIVAAVEKRAPL